MIFSTDDPLGRRVILKKGTWDYKLILNRPEIELYLDDIKVLVQDPYYIVKDFTETETGEKVVHSTREEYFDFIPSRQSTGFVILKTVVDHNTDPGEIVTAHISSKTRGFTTEGGVIHVRGKKGQK